MKALTRRINENTLEYLSAIVDFVRSPQARQADSVSDFARDVALNINEDDLQFVNNIRDLRARLLLKKSAAIEEPAVAP